MIIDGVTRLKWLPRDRLKRGYQDGRDTAVQHDDNPEMQIPNLDIESSSSSDDDNANNEQPGYNLRPRPTQQIDRLVVSQICFI